jgi:hypothetical protein
MRTQNLIFACWEMDAALQPDMRTTPTTATTPSSGKRVRHREKIESPVLTYVVCVSDALVAEIKRIVKESDILKYATAVLGVQ